MAKIWNHIKDWLIKKLGGYTKAEYDIAAVARYEFIPPPEWNNIIKVCAEGKYHHFDEPPREWIESHLVEELAREIKPYVRWETNIDYCDMMHNIRAIVKVVDND